MNTSIREELTKLEDADRVRSYADRVRDKALYDLIRLLLAEKPGHDAITQYLRNNPKVAQRIAKTALGVGETK